MNSNNKNNIQNSSIKAGGNVHIGDIINIEHPNPVTEKPADAKSLDYLRALISKNKIKECLEQLLVVSKHKDSDLYNDVILQSQKWNSLQQEKQQGVISTSEEQLRRSKIVHAVLGVLDALEAEG